ncbi:AI-2E family transporter [Nisaea acidiphila]|uniref:AI-2E family transporter n=1 Tax=Nisaea acidiphila TaxID=1862145 RepID=A0A9J7AXG3_9PROT|nr:AI-2E family transporter [Nisaea acidiphila]UUX50940.1 AI-2E family transporter [Nisaea acidiphila]
MTQRERLAFWVGLLAAFLLAVYVLKSVLVPFAAGMAIAYFLDPIVDRCERIGMSRTLGTAVVLLGFFLAGTGVLLLLIPLIQAQVVLLAETLPKYIERLSIMAEPLLDMARAWLGDGGADKLNLPAIATQAGKWILSFAGELLSGGAALANLVSLLVITPIVAFYLLRDWDHIVAAIDGWLPRAQANTIREQAGIIDSTLASFVRGQGTVCLILGGFYAVGLSLAGLDFGVIIGLFAGLISFVPFVGSIFGGALSIGLAALQFDSLTPIAIIAAIFVAGQAIEGNFLTPNLVGDAVGLHPVWVMFALLAGGALFGFLGVLIAVPVAAVIGVLVRFALSRYLASPLHLHGIPPADDETDGN